MSKIVVIGGNHAGTAAINTITDNYPHHEVVVFERNSNISFLGCGMALWIGDQIDGSEKLFYASKEGFEKKGVTVHMETEVTSADFDKKVLQVRKKDGTIMEESYDKLIIATGSLPVIPEVPGGNLANIHKVKLYQDAVKVIEKLALSEIRHIAVIGSGYIGVELAEAFQRKGKEATLIDIADTCLSSYYDAPFTAMMEENLRDHGIKLMFHAKVEGFEGKDKVEKVLTTKGSVEADMAIWAVGFKPNSELGKGALELFSNGAYLVNEKQETSRQDVYAVGDCVTLWDNAADRTNYIALATNAVRSGIVAAHNACGTELTFPGVQGSNAISIYGLNMVSTGLTQEKAKNEGIEAIHTDFEDYQRPLFMRTNEKVKIRIVFEKSTRRIIGAQLASKYDISLAIHMFSLAIEKKVTIDELKLLDLFFLPHFNQPYNYITMAALGAPNT